MRLRLHPQFSLVEQQVTDFGERNLPLTRHRVQEEGEHQLLPLITRTEEHGQMVIAVCPYRLRSVGSIPQHLLACVVADRASPNVRRLQNVVNVAVILVVHLRERRHAVELQQVAETFGVGR